MGCKTPNIDRIAKEGMLFTDSYGEQSCTAGRSSFITGQSVYRTGLSKLRLTQPYPRIGAMLSAATLDLTKLGAGSTHAKRPAAAKEPPPLFGDAPLLLDRLPRVGLAIARKAWPLR